MGGGTAGLMETESICEGAYIGELRQLAKRLASYCSMGASIPIGFPGGASGKEPTCSAGDSRDVGSIPESGRSLGGGNGNHSSILAWKRISRTEELGMLRFMGSLRVGCHAAAEQQ